MKKKIIDSFREPFKNPNCRLNLLIGGVMTFFPFINFISLGFLATKLEKSIEQDKTPVKWDENIRQLFIKGLKMAAIGGIYLVLPLLFALLGSFFILSLGQGKIFSIFYFRGQVLNIIATLLLLGSLYLLPFSVCLFLEGKSMKKGFDIKETMERILLVIKEYTAIYAIIISQLVISAIIILFLMNWVAGILIGGFIAFYDGLVITNLLCKFFPRKSININIK